MTAPREDRPARPGPDPAHRSPPGRDESADPVRDPDRRAAEADPPSPSLPAALLGGDDPVPCIACGYDLRGIAADGACPECGAPVERSLGSDALGDSHPDWRARIALGLRLIAVAPGLLVLVPILTWIAAAILPGSGASNLVRQMTDGVLQALLLAAVVLAVAGGLLATTIEPRDRDLEDPRAPRRLARVGILLVIATYLVFALVESLFGLPAPGPQIANLAFALALGAFSLAFGRWLSGLLRRVPDLELAQRIELHGRFFGWAPATIMGYYVVEPLVGRGRPGGGGGGGGIAWQAFELLFVVVSCTLAVVVILAFVRTITAWITLARAGRAVQTAPSRRDDPLASPLPTHPDAGQAVFPSPPPRSDRGPVS